MKNCYGLAQLKSPFMVYFIVVGIFCFFMFPCVDSFYYWDWSQNLQLSYYDGPPLIAYTIKAITFILGNNVFALNFVGVIFALFSAFLIYKIGALSDKSVGTIAALLWLIFPFGVTRFILTNVTYDGLESIFNLAIIYTVLLYLNHRETSFIYLIGILAGLLLLSKYSGIILLFSLLVFLACHKQYRSIYKTYHIYLAMLLCCIIFSPVLIWNYQHNWISFKYQLTTHLWSTDQHFNSHEPNKKWWQGMVFYLWDALLGSENILLLLTLYIFLRKKPIFNCNLMVYLLLWLSVEFVIFWLCLSPFAHVSLSYTLPLTSSLILMVSYYIKEYNYIKLYNFLIIVFAIISLVMLFGKCNINEAKNQGCYQTQYNSKAPNCYDGYITNHEIKWH